MIPQLVGSPVLWDDSASKLEPKTKKKTALEILGPLVQISWHPSAGQHQSGGDRKLSEYHRWQIYNHRLKAYSIAVYNDIYIYISYIQLFIYMSVSVFPKCCVFDVNTTQSKMASVEGSPFCPSGPSYRMRREQRVPSPGGTLKLSHCPHQIIDAADHLIKVQVIHSNTKSSPLITQPKKIKKVYPILEYLASEKQQSGGLQHSSSISRIRQLKLHEASKGSNF